MSMEFLRYDCPLGRLVRTPLRLIPKDWMLPVLSGANRGRRWIVGAGVHQCWLGSYEREHMTRVLGFVTPGMTVFDVGAHAGYYTLAFARVVGDRRHVIAFEPDPTNLAALKRHIAVNSAGNVEIVAAAVSDRVGTIRFARDPSGYQGRIGEGDYSVASVRLDGYGAPDVVKMDIEGAEGSAITAASAILAQRRTRFFIALHGVSDDTVRAELQRHGYRFEMHWDVLHAWPDTGAG